MSDSPSNPTVIDALFATFIATYGAPKLRSMWGGTARELVVAQWTDTLSRFRPEAIKRAAMDVVDLRGDDGQRRAWPPSLPEFLDLVEEHDRALRRRESLSLPDSRPLVPDSPLMDPDRAREALREILSIARGKVTR